MELKLLDARGQAASKVEAPDTMVTAEVDSSRLARLKQKYPEARIYVDWREMLDKERKNLDIACVGTPDHMHAPTTSPPHRGRTQRAAPTRKQRIREPRLFIQPRLMHNRRAVHERPLHRTRCLANGAPGAKRMGSPHPLVEW